MNSAPGVAARDLDGMLDAVLGALDPEQRAAVTAPRGPVCIVAGAGTGKTRTITHRIAHGALAGTVPPDRLLAVTFTARAAGELRTRLRALGVAGVQARTFHAAALRQLQFFWPRTVGGDLPRLVESKVRLLAEAVARRLGAGRAELRDLAAEIEWAKATLVGPDGYEAAATAAGRHPPRAPGEVAAAFAAYEAAKQQAGLLDFEDLLLLTAGLLEEHRDVAAQVRDRYRHFVVDEYQDVNPLQQQLLDAWLGGRDDLCVVGDPHQTIYSFTGASPSYLLGFTARYPEATVVRLVRDYRSTPQVVALANRLIGPAGSAQQLVAQRPAGPEPTLREHDDELAEAAAVAREIAALVAGGTPVREIAVLFRTNGQSETYEQALTEAGVPYVLRGGERFFERPEVREAVALLRGAARSPQSGAPGGLAATVRHVLAAAGLGPEPPAGSGAARGRWESLVALARLADDHAAAAATRAGDGDGDGGEAGAGEGDKAGEGTVDWAGLPGFLAELDARIAAQHAPPVDGVTLASLHAAKGLEWDAVFLVGLTDGMVPISYAETPAQLEEERRLLYVGVTRARERVSLSWARARAPGGRGGRRPSRFLDGLLPRGARPAAAAGQRAGRRSRGGPPPCRVCGRPLMAAVERKLGRCEGCPADLDEALFDRLREWRRAAAKERGQPAYCIFTDATLQAIAETRPATVAELAAIPGVGQRKLGEFGADVLAMVGGAPAGPSGS
ncbi:MAG: ATP-dependent DNA helicase UvrD2 [Frankiaceae bacterium]